MTVPPRPHPATRSPRVDRVNRLLVRLWDAGLTPRPTLDPDALRRSADWNAQPPSPARQGDDADFTQRFDRLCASVAREAALNPLGTTMAHGQLVRVLKQRQELARYWSANPEVLDTPLAPPIIVVGQMRSGTTRLHRLLSADPAHASTRFCDSWHPVPKRPDMRAIWSALTLRMGRAINPWLDSIHPMEATRTEEELGWLAGALNHAPYEAQWRIPSYTAFGEAHDPTPIYREFLRVLRTDAANRRNADRPRVLKVPQFSEDVAALMAAFPDARFVRAIRDTKDVVRSSISLVANQMTIQTDRIDMVWLEAEVARKVALREERMAVAFAAFEGPVSIARFDDLNADWQTEMARIYAELDMSLSQEARAAMQAEHDRASGGDHRTHSRQLEAFRRPAAAD